MRRLLLILSILLAVASQAAASVWYSVNYDKKTVAAMTAAFGTETVTEMYYSEQVRKILDHYSAAEVATAGIFMSKYLDRKALTELGIWSSATENYYYRRIYSLVSTKIMPKIWTVAGMMLRSPQTALYWGSYLFKVCHEVETVRCLSVTWYFCSSPRSSSPCLILPATARWTGAVSSMISVVSPTILTRRTLRRI